jgi:hypothetical protein
MSDHFATFVVCISLGCAHAALCLVVMAGPIQVGDIIKFTELAWTVWNYGWASEYDAGWRLPSSP